VKLAVNVVLSVKLLLNDSAVASVIKGLSLQLVNVNPGFGIAVTVTGTPSKYTPDQGKFSGIIVEIFIYPAPGGFTSKVTVTWSFKSK
jgi:hypothetical protein